MRHISFCVTQIICTDSKLQHLLISMQIYKMQGLDVYTAGSVICLWVYFCLHVIPLFAINVNCLLQ